MAEQELPLTPPVRIQRSRTKGWRMPGNAIYVGRPTMWGNRWKIGSWSNTLGRNVETLGEAVDLYRRLMWPDSHHRAWVREMLARHDLACWCPLLYPDGSVCPCHADFLLEIANP